MKKYYYVLIVWYSSYYNEGLVIVKKEIEGKEKKGEKRSGRETYLPSKGKGKKKRKTYLPLAISSPLISLFYSLEPLCHHCWISTLSIADYKLLCFLTCVVVSNSPLLSLSKPLQPPTSLHWQKQTCCRSCRAT